jgi:DNA-directed RNA polymerase subunit RPC12/RpoP
MTTRTYVCADCGATGLVTLGPTPSRCPSCRVDRNRLAQGKVARPPSVTAEQLSAVEAEVLQRLAASRVTISAVKLAAEMAGDFDGHLLNHEISFELIQFILNGLNEQGLVVYRIAPQMFVTDAGATEWIETARSKHGVPVHIRVTEEGYAAIGYTTRAVTVGVRRSYRGEAPVRRGDPTDFRNQGFMAVAFGVIERCGLAEHLTRYPDHAYATPGGF